jgi:ribosome-associated translation inhibitor RaiA
VAFEANIEQRGFAMDPLVERRVRRRLASLGRRLAHHPEPRAVLRLWLRKDQRRYDADLRVRLEPLGAHLVSHQHAETPDRAARLAVEDAERQLERRVAGQRGEPTFAVPSRREPRRLRPNPPPPAAEVARADEGEER